MNQSYVTMNSGTGTVKFKKGVGNKNDFAFEYSCPISKLHFRYEFAFFTRFSESLSTWSNFMTKCRIVAPPHFVSLRRLNFLEFLSTTNCSEYKYGCMRQDCRGGRRGARGRPEAIRNIIQVQLELASTLGLAGLGLLQHGHVSRCPPPHYQRSMPGKRQAITELSFISAPALQPAPALAPV